MKRILSFILCMAICIGLFCPVTAQAQEAWPQNVSISAEGGIVMDASTGTVLYGKNIHTPYYPASITKVLTALIVLENCRMDEMVTFSHNAVYNVEAGSSSAGMDEGDIMSVKDCLYGLILKSANEIANALAEHVAGTTEAFAEMMNEKAASLGCTDSHFANPSGLNDPNHYTSAYDMALIGQAAMKNPEFMEICSTLYYDLPPSKRNPEGGRVYPGHKMLKKNMPEYYEGCIGGKTGYTSLAGNTLITFARRDGMELVTVVLNGHQTHYTDTKALLDFGFQNFYTVNASGYDTTYASVENDMQIAGLSTSDLAGIRLDPAGRITLPKEGSFSSVTSRISYELPEDAPASALGQVEYLWGERKIGSVYLNLDTAKTPQISVPSTTLAEITGITLEPETSTEKAGAAKPEEQSSSLHIPSVVWTALGVMLALTLVIGLLIFLKLQQEKKEAQARLLRRQKRLERLSDSGISAAEFDLLMQERRALRTSSRTKTAAGHSHRASGKKHRNHQKNAPRS